MTTENFNETSRVARALNTVLSGIIAGRYSNALPPQEALSKELNVSRTVLREALVILRFCNVLAIRPKIGTTIRPSTEWKSALLGIVEEAVEAPRNHELESALKGLGAAR